MRFSFALIVIHVCHCVPIEKVVAPPPISALDFMKQYGYLKSDKGTSAALYTEDGLSEAIKTVQRFGALKETGKLDNATLKLMETPRCGNADVIQGRRSKRFLLTSGWNKRHITYYIANWSSKLGEETVARLIGKALNTWGAYGSLKFSRKSTPDADIIVSFARGFHNDPFPFDGPGYVLAHAYFPNSGSEISGDIHFDDDEDWVESGPQEILERGTDFYSVALHELGHSLGLAHSNDPRSVMFPYYKGDDETSLQLGQDDIMAMYQLYIARPIQETTETTTTTRRRRPFNTRPPNEPPRTRPPEEPTRTTRLYTRTTEPTIYTRTPSYRPTTSDETRTSVRSTYYPPTRTRSTYYPSTHDTRSTLHSTRTTFTTPTPSTFYPTTRTTNEETTTRTTYTGWYSTTSPNAVRTTTFKSNNRFPSTGFSTVNDRRPGNSNRDPSFTPTRRQSTTPPPEPNICRGKFDSVANLRGEIFVFKDEYVWRLLDRNRIVPGYPILLRQMFPFLPEKIKKIDAAYQRPDGNMIFFTGDLYWVYDGTNFIENSPRNIIYYGVPFGIGGIDAIHTWGRNGKTYLFKNDRFWRFDETTKSVDPGYPQHIEKWRGIPRNIDAATTWIDGKTYFFKDNLYWTLDNRRVEATRDSPRSSTREWLGCP